MSTATQVRTWFSYIVVIVEPLFRVHPWEQGKCSLHRSVPWMEAGLGIANNYPQSVQIKYFLSFCLRICYSQYFKQLDNAVILLQIVMMSPKTHLVKNHESQSKTNESQFKKKYKSWKCLGLKSVCYQIVNLKTDSKLCITVYWNENKLYM